MLALSGLSLEAITYDDAYCLGLDIDRRDCLTDDQVRAAARSENSKEFLTLAIDEYEQEAIWRQVNDAVWELKKKLTAEIKAAVDRFFDDNRDAIEGEIEKRAKYETNALARLASQTQKRIVFIEVAYLDEWDCRDERDVAMTVTAISQKLGMEDDGLRELVENAAGCRHMVVFFTVSVEDYLLNDEARDTITIKKPVLALVDFVEGAGYDIRLKGDVSLPYSRKAVLIDGSVGYSYTEDVCSLSSSWCDSEIKFSFEGRESDGKEPMALSIRADQERYEAAYKAGGCTLGDVNIKRHRKTKYHNDPGRARTQCDSCGQVWMD